MDHLREGKCNWMCSCLFSECCCITTGPVYCCRIAATRDRKDVHDGNQTGLTKHSPLLLDIHPSAHSWEWLPPIDRCLDPVSWLQHVGRAKHQWLLGLCPHTSAGISLLPLCMRRSIVQWIERKEFSCQSGTIHVTKIHYPMPPQTFLIDWRGKKSSPTISHKL